MKTDKIVIGKNQRHKGKDIIIRLKWNQNLRRYTGYDPYECENVEFDLDDLYDINSGKYDTKTYKWQVI